MKGTKPSSAITHKMTLYVQVKRRIDTESVLTSTVMHSYSSAIRQSNNMYISFNLSLIAKALAKFLAWQLTSDNANSTRWIKYANILEQDPGIYKQCVNSTNKELSKAEQRQRCEAFLLYWADHYVHPQENKV